MHYRKVHRYVGLTANLAKSNNYALIIHICNTLHMPAKDKLFSLRLPSALSDGLTWARTILGENVTTGEAARRLMEERLDQMRRLEIEKQTTLQDRPRQTFLNILSKQQTGDPLIPAEWAFLAQAAHQAYDAAYHKKDTVNRDLLVANFCAFGAVIKLRNESSQSKVNIDDSYYLGNFGGGSPRDLVSRVDKVVTELPRFPSIGSGMFGARNLKVILQEESQLDVAKLDIALRPYLSALIQIGLRGYWYTEGATVHEGMENELTPSYPLKPIKYEMLTLTPFGSGRKIGAVLDYGDVMPSLMSLKNFIEFSEFAELLDRALSNQEPSMIAKTEGFSLYYSTMQDSKQSFMLEDNRYRFFFGVEDIARLKHLFDLALDDPEIQNQLHRAAFSYGRI